MYYHTIVIISELFYTNKNNACFEADFLITQYICIPDHHVPSIEY